MAKLTTRIAVPIILAGVFVIVIFLAANMGGAQLGFGSYFFIIFLAAYVFFFGIAIGQSMVGPIRKILDSAKELSRGNLSGRIYLETKDELSELANVLNKIAEELEASYDHESNAKKSIDIKVRAKTQQLEETIYALEQKVRNRTTELEKLIKESGRLQQDVKSKEAEISVLKKELGSFKQRIGKYNKQKQEDKIEAKPEAETETENKAKNKKEVK